MSTITKEQLRERAREKVKSLEFAVTQAAFADSRAELEEELELARIALASLEAGPAIHRWRRVTSEPYGPYPWHYGDFIGFSKPVDGIEDEYFYSAPPAPAPVSDEDKVLAEQARAVIHCLDMCGVPSGDYADNEQLQLWGRVIEYGRHPASVSVPAAMEMDDDFDSAFEHGKAVGWNAYRAAMLQAADGNSLVIPEGWVACSEQMPEQFKAILAFNEYGEVWSGAYDRYWNFYCDNLLVEHVTHWMPLPAAPQQEA